MSYPHPSYTRRFIIPVLALIASLTGACTSDYSPSFEEKPVLVINVIASPGEPIEASVTHSWPVGELVKGNVDLPDAEVQLVVNDGAPIRMTYDAASARFRSDRVARAADRICVSASHPDYGSASGATTVPRPVVISDWKCTHRVETDYNGYIYESDGTWGHPRMVRFVYSVTFSDPVDEENYYLVSSDLDCDDPIIDENNTPLEAIFIKSKDFYVFSDRQINGKTYTLTCSKTYTLHYILPGEDFINRISVYSISKEYYLYLLSLYKKYETISGALEEIGLAEPRSVYSNVSSGAGVVAAQAPTTIINDVAEIMRHYFQSQ